MKGEQYVQTKNSGNRAPPRNGLPGCGFAALHRALFGSAGDDGKRWLDDGLPPDGDEIRCARLYFYYRHGAVL